MPKNKGQQHVKSLKQHVTLLYPNKKKKTDHKTNYLYRPHSLNYTREAIRCYSLNRVTKKTTPLPPNVFTKVNRPTAAVRNSFSR